MTGPKTDERSPERRAKDELIAAEPQKPPLDLPPDASAAPVETHLHRKQRQPMAVAGIVENGLIRLLDHTVKLPEHSRVIIVASDLGSK